MSKHLRHLEKLVNSINTNESFRFQRIERLEEICEELLNVVIDQNDMIESLEEKIRDLQHDIRKF